MTICLTLDELLVIDDELLNLDGVMLGVRDLGLIQSATAQPQSSFFGEELYPTLPEKVAALGYSLVLNHGFNDGNKRVGWTSLDVFLRRNGLMMVVNVDEAEQVILQLAAGQLSREVFTEWVMAHSQPKKTPPEKDSHGA